MKEMKFRAWDKKNGIWFPDSLTFDSFGHVRMCFQHNNLPDNTRIKSNVIGDPAPTLMQYTGLKDKNGVEIYEGDIVQHVGDDGRHYYLDRLTNNDDAMPLGTVAITTHSGVVCKFPTGRFRQFWEDHMTSGERELKGRWTMYSTQERWLVVGNIYDNPELLAGGDRG